MNLHFDGVCSLALGKLVKVVSIRKAKRPYRKGELCENVALGTMNAPLLFLWTELPTLQGIRDGEGLLS